MRNPNCQMLLDDFPNGSLTMDECLVEKHWACTINSVLWKAVPILQLVIGTVGNILSGLVLSRPRFKRLPSSLYLRCLAVSDTMVLWGNVLVFLLEEGYQYNLRNKYNVFCSGVFWLGHTWASCSVYLMTLLAIERLVVTMYPLRARIWLTGNVTKVLCIGTTVWCTCVSSHYLYGMEIRMIPSLNSVNETSLQPTCTSKISLESFYKAWDLFVLILFVLVPVTITSISSLIIAVTMIIHRRKQALQVYPQSQAGTTVHGRNSKSLTVMLILISMLLATTIPYTVNSVVSSGHYNMNSPITASAKLRATVARLILYCNYTFNFFLYCLAGSLFRQEMKAFLKELGVKIRLRRIESIA